MMQNRKGGIPPLPFLCGYVTRERGVFIIPYHYHHQPIIAITQSNNATDNNTITIIVGIIFCG